MEIDQSRLNQHANVGYVAITVTFVSGCKNVNDPKHNWSEFSVGN